MGKDAGHKRGKTGSSEGPSKKRKGVEVEKKLGNKHPTNKDKYNKETRALMVSNKYKRAAPTTPVDKRQQRTDRIRAAPAGELKLQALKLWEDLRRGDLATADRRSKMDQMMALIRGRIKEVTFKHDMSRVIQTCVKMGTDAQRNEIAQELQGSYLDLARSTYGKHIVMAILKYSNKYRGDVVRAFHGHVRATLRHRDASAVLEECYAVYANSAQRWQLAAELYGAELAVFKDDAAKSVDDVLANAPQKRDAIVAGLLASLGPLLQKGTVQHSIVHRALADYLRLAPAAARQKMIEDMRELCVEVLHTRDGAHAAQLCVAHGTAKDRKAIAKSLRTYVMRVAREEHGYAVLVALLDCMDDTVYAGKTLLAELAANIAELAADQHGRRVLLYVLAGRHPQYVGSDALQIMRATDEARSLTSKKDASTRHRELANHLSAPLLRWVADHAEAVFEPLPSQTITEALLRCAPGAEKQNAWDAVLKLVGRSIEDAHEGDKHVLLSPVASRVLSACIRAEHSAPTSPDASLPELPADNPPFGSDVLEALAEDDRLVEAACAGAFPVRVLLESPVTGEKARGMLRPHSKQIAKALAAKPERPRSLAQIVELLG
ncbi:Pumilio y domain member 6 [Coemansia interrupta]|uniref:Pumilio y domain member 6 n=1 Tax=Coemansia interrupta TaxID=1126814 RepID=A0A9W8LHI5_9FUNG|nr:Pumilio y domain member 6 [Coemansia interrupta]